MYVSPSFSATYFLIELNEAGNLSGKIGVLVEPYVSSSVVCNEGWSSGAFSFRSACDTMVSSLVVWFR